MDLVELGRLKRLMLEMETGATEMNRVANVILDGWEIYLSATVDDFGLVVFHAKAASREGLFEFNGRMRTVFNGIAAL